MSAATTAAEAYAARIDAALDQQRRLRPPRPGGGSGDRWEGIASFFRADPRRTDDPSVEFVARYVRPDDVLIDVGGGAGRLALPLALRCRAVVNVDPSPSMAREFTDSAVQAGIDNVRIVESGWMEATGIEGDVVLAASVTYFVREIVPFVEKLHAAARRRVLIKLWSVPPPASHAGAFAVVFGEPMVLPPSYRELLPVLWEMDILPELLVTPARAEGISRRMAGQSPGTRDEAVAFVLDRVQAEETPAARARIEAHFDDLFDRRDGAFVPRWLPKARELVITWETRPS
jgi:hypothetical protein